MKLPKSKVKNSRKKNKKIPRGLVGLLIMLEAQHHQSPHPPQKTKPQTHTQTF